MHTRVGFLRVTALINKLALIEWYKYYAKDYSKATLHNIDYFWGELQKWTPEADAAREAEYRQSLTTYISNGLGLVWNGLIGGAFSQGLTGKW